MPLLQPEPGSLASEYRRQFGWRGWPRRTSRLWSCPSGLRSWTAVPDPADEHVVDCAMNAGAPVVTANVRDFAKARRELGLLVLTAPDFVVWLGSPEVPLRSSLPEAEEGPEEEEGEET